MKKNFKIGQSNELEQGEKFFDLHNCYDFSGFYLEAKKALLFFEPDLDYGEGLPSIVIEFIGLIYLGISSNFCSTKKVHLDEMGYKNPGDFDDEWLLGEAQADEKDHMFFRFVGGQSVRLLASQAKLKEVRMQVKTAEGLKDT